MKWRYFLNPDLLILLNLLDFLFLRGVAQSGSAHALGA